MLAVKHHLSTAIDGAFALVQSSQYNPYRGFGSNNREERATVGPIDRNPLAKFLWEQELVSRSLWRSSNDKYAAKKPKNLKEFAVRYLAPRHCLASLISAIGHTIITVACLFWFVKFRAKAIKASYQGNETTRAQYAQKAYDAGANILIHTRQIVRHTVGITPFVGPLLKFGFDLALASTEKLADKVWDERVSKQTQDKLIRIGDKAIALVTGHHINRDIIQPDV